MPLLIAGKGSVSSSGVFRKQERRLSPCTTNGLPLELMDSQHANDVENIYKCPEDSNLINGNRELYFLLQVAKILKTFSLMTVDI